MVVFRCAGIVLLVAIAAAGQGTWVMEPGSWSTSAGAVQPVQRTEAGLVFDSFRMRRVVFGGRVQGVSLGDTWEWDGQAWLQLTPAPSPSPRFGFAMTYDALRGVSVLYGGHDAAGPLADVWEWDGVTWTNAMPATGPAAGGSIAWFAPSAVTVLLTGTGETWEWSGASWSQRFPTASPAAGELAYDEVRGLVVALDVAAGETWEWDGTDWTQTFPVAPPATSSGKLTFDPVAGGVAWLGALTTSPWYYDGATWTSTGGPVPWNLGQAALAFDRRCGRLVTFGGNASVSVPGITSFPMPTNVTWTHHRPPLVPGQSNVPFQASLEIACSGAPGEPFPGPYRTFLVPGEPTTLRLRGLFPSAFHLLVGPLNPGAATFGSAGALDVGTPPAFIDVSVVFSGATPIYSGGSGLAELVFVPPVSLPRGLALGSVQAVVIPPFWGSSPILFTAAHELFTAY